jgi:mannose-1-phosphate guanylyltransferase
LPLLDRPYLAWLVQRCVKAGITNILVNVHYQSQQVQNFLGNGDRFGAKIDYVIETEPLDTAGAILLAQPKLTGDTLMVFNADILTDLDLNQLAQFHRSTGAEATLTLTRVPDIQAFGLVELEHDRVVAFHEKPDPVRAEAFLARGITTVNAGTYVLEPHLFHGYTVGQPLSFERVFFPQTLSQGHKMMGWVWSGYWLDLGTPAKYVQGQLDILQGKLATAWEMPDTVEAVLPQGWISRSAVIAPHAQINAPCFVGEYSFLGDHAVIPPNTIIGSHCLIDRAIEAGVYGDRSIVL